MHSIYKRIINHLLKKKFLYGSCATALLGIVLLVGTFVMTKGVTPHASELAFIEHSKDAIGSIIPASCESGLGEGGVAHGPWQRCTYADEYGCWNYETITDTSGWCGRVALTANPTRVPLGNASMLSWSVAGVSNCSGVGFTPVPPSTSGSVSSGPLNVLGVKGFALYCAWGNISIPPVTAEVLVVSAAPIANAGPDIKLPRAPYARSVSPIGASASDPDGTPVIIQWSLVSKPGGAPDPVIVGAGPVTVPSGSASVPQFTNLNPPIAPGQYVFRMTVTDTADPLTVVTDDMRVIAPDLGNPIANAGPDQVIVLPTEKVDSINASVKDLGSEVKAWWELVSKPAGAQDPEIQGKGPDPKIDDDPDTVVALARMSGPVGYSIQTEFADLDTPGMYVFKLRAKDHPISGGGTVPNNPDSTYAEDTMTVEVLASAQPNCPAQVISGCTLLSTPYKGKSGSCSPQAGTCSYTCEAGGKWDIANGQNSCTLTGAPQANAGPDRTITLPTSLVDTLGSAITYPPLMIEGTTWVIDEWNNGYLVPSGIFSEIASPLSYQWRLISSPGGAPPPTITGNGAIQNINAQTGGTYGLSARFSNLTSIGAYVFELAVANGYNLTNVTDVDPVTITVLPPSCAATIDEKCILPSIPAGTTIGGTCQSSVGNCNYSCDSTGNWIKNSNSCTVPSEPDCPAGLLGNSCTLPRTNPNSPADGTCSVGYVGDCTYQCKSTGGEWDEQHPIKACEALDGDLDADPIVVDSGDTTELTWDSNGTTCEVTGNGETISGPSDATRTSAPITADTTYNLECDNSGKVLDFVDIEVRAPMTLTTPDRVIQLDPDTNNDPADDDGVPLDWTVPADEGDCTLSGPGISVNPMPTNGGNIREGRYIVSNVAGRSTYTASCPDPVVPGNPPLTRRVTIEVIPIDYED